MKQLLLFLFIISGLSFTGYAQIMKSLKDKIYNKTESKSSSSKEKSAAQYDSLMNQYNLPEYNTTNLGAFAGSMGSVSPSVLPDAYVFSHIYKIRMKSGQGNFDLEYYLTKSSNFLGSSVNAGNNMQVKMVHDYERSLMVNYLNGKPMVMKIPPSTNSTDDKEKPYTIKPLPNRNFLGYDCPGKQMENEDFVLTVYIAPSLGVGMCNPFEREAGNPNPAFTLRGDDKSNGLVMFMDIVDKKNKGKKSASGTMECISFEPKQTVIKNR